MEPKHSSSEVGPQEPRPIPESLPSLPNVEASPESPTWTPDTDRPAQMEKAGELSSQAQASVAAQAASHLTLPAPVPMASDDSGAAVADANPAVAADEDLIEKEWVDRAKKIISDTRDDPAARERQVGQLQADYLKKRYGKELGAAD